MKTSLQKKPLLCLLCVSLLLGGSACKKVEETFPITEKMPDATEDGKGTFGCLVEGKLWLPYNPDASSLFPADYKLRTNSFPVNASVFTIDAKNRRENAGTESLTLRVSSTSAIKPGTYTLRDGFSATATTNASATVGSEMYDTANTGSGTLTITKVEPVTKTVNGITTRSTIVSGTFQFTARSQNGKTVTVTSGRFDLSPFQ